MSVSGVVQPGCMREVTHLRPSADWVSLCDGFRSQERLPLPLPVPVPPPLWLALHAGLERWLSAFESRSVPLPWTRHQTEAETPSYSSSMQMQRQVTGRRFAGAWILVCFWKHHVSYRFDLPMDSSGYTYVSLSLRLRLPRRVVVSSGILFVSSLLSSMARRSCSSSSYAASRLFMVDRRFGFGPSLCRDLGSLERREVSREEAREEGAGDDTGETGR